MAVPTLEAEKLPSNQDSVNAPTSGEYGEGAALERLKAALPVGAIGQPSGPTPPQLPPISPQVAPTGPSAPEGAPPGPPTVPGLPSVMMHPTQQPNIPVGTPLSGGPPQVSPLTEAQRRLQILDQLSEAPGVSDTTRQWAILVRRVLLGA